MPRNAACLGRVPHDRPTPRRLRLGRDEILDVNRRYHDAAAPEYDTKWGIDFGELGRAQVLGKVRKLLGRNPGQFARSLEIGAGTGYFTLNLMQAGVVASAVCTDVSPRMLATLRGNAARLGIEVETAACDAAALPFADGSFDLLLGHAVLHHLPELERSFAEFMRVLRPGGMLVFAGEPSRHGDRIAALPKRAGVAAAPLWRRLVHARALSGSNGRPDDHALECMVDVHAFTPADLDRHAGAAGFADVRVRGEELLANWFGWFNRTVEASAVHADIPSGWFHYAHRGYLLLQKVDATVLEPRLPAAGFYNLMLAARKPVLPTSRGRVDLRRQLGTTSE